MPVRAKERERLKTLLETPIRKAPKAMARSMALSWKDSTVARIPCLVLSISQAIEAATLPEKPKPAKNPLITRIIEFTGSK